MRAFVQTALVAHNLARVQSRATPRGGLGGVAVETPAAEVLRLFGRGVVGVLHGQTGVGGEIGEGHVGIVVGELVLLLVVLVVGVLVCVRVPVRVPCDTG